MTVLNSDQIFLGTGSVELLELERDRLQNSCNHLERSNAELKQAIEDFGPDPDFKEAIQENIVAIAKQRARIASLQEEIDRDESNETELNANSHLCVPTGTAATEPLVQQQQASCPDVFQSSAAKRQEQPSQSMEAAAQPLPPNDKKTNAGAAAPTIQDTAMAQADHNEQQSLWL